MSLINEYIGILEVIIIIIIIMSIGVMLSPSSKLLAPIRRCCSYTLLSTMFKACGFVLIGEKNNNIVIQIIIQARQVIQLV